MRARRRRSPRHRPRPVAAAAAEASVGAHLDAAAVALARRGALGARRRAAPPPLARSSVSPSDRSAPAQSRCSPRAAGRSFSPRSRSPSPRRFCRISAARSCPAHRITPIAGASTRRSPPSRPRSILPRRSRPPLPKGASPRASPPPPPGSRCSRGCWRAVDAADGARAGRRRALLSPTVHPWYALWLLPLLAERPTPGWLALASLLPLSYLGRERGIRLVEYGVPFVIAVASMARRGRPRLTERLTDRGSSL